MPTGANGTFKPIRARLFCIARAKPVVARDINSVEEAPFQPCEAPFSDRRRLSQDSLNRPGKVGDSNP